MIKGTIFTILSFSSLMSLAADFEVERGRYLVKTMSCNDCHTPGYAMSSGQVPEKDWLIGTNIGYFGPWGTSYAANLRRIANSMDQRTWYVYLQNLKARPPMPSYDLNIIKASDANAIYKFIRSLGDSPNEVPAALPPGKQPKTMYFNFNINMPK